MKAATVERLTQSNAPEGVSFGISKSNEAHIMGILRDSLYTDKILAVLREYGANAWDAHRMSGKGDVPIKVSLPEYGQDTPTLVIRDFGPGLSKEDVYSIYTQYGESTKRSDDTAVGMLGIGSKSGFCYAESFIVISYHGGVKTTYVAALDASDKGVLQLLAQEPTEETGVEIRITVKPSDISRFHSTAGKLFRYFTPRPEINTSLASDPDDTIKLTAGTVNTHFASYDGGSWTAVMGCVPYRIRLDDLPLPDDHKCLHRLSGTLAFEIGDLQISASREELQYKPKTVQALLDKFTLLVDEFILKVVKDFDSSTKSHWEKRLHAQAITRLDLPLSEEITDYAKGWVRLFEDADKGPFLIVHNGSATNQVSVDADVKILVDDTNKKLKGYRLHRHEYVVRPKGNRRVVTDEQTLKLIADLEKQLEANKLTGVTIEKLSSRYYYSSSSGRRSADPANRLKHRATMFSLIPDRGYGKPYSSHWEIVTRVPTDDDVYIVLQDFEGKGYSNFYGDARRDAKLAEAFGETMPVIYGYKHTDKKPVDVSTLKGKSYAQWRQDWLKTLLTPTRMKQISAIFSVDAVPCIPAKTLTSLAKSLGGKHPLIRHLCTPRRLRKKYAQVFTSHSLKDALSNLAYALEYKDTDSEAGKQLTDLYTAYPLLKLYGLETVWTNHYAEADLTKDERRQIWLDYIKMIDSRNTP